MQRQSSAPHALAALVLSVALAVSGCGVIVRAATDGYDHVARGGLTADGRIGKLTDKEKRWAKIAWRYFENNTNAQTGLVNSIDRYPAATMWHVGDYLAALVSAHELGVIDAREFDARMSKLLNFLNTMDLAGGKLPNKVYNTLNGAMVDYANQAGEVGWSAMDLGRLLAWMRIAGERHPQFREYLDKVVLRWSFCGIIDACGTLSGATKSANGFTPYQEGRFGTEQYAASGFAAWGFATLLSETLIPVDYLYVYDIRVPYDGRDPRTTGVQAPLTTLPWGLLGIEYGWNVPGGQSARTEAAGLPGIRDTADRVYKVQEQRFRREGIYTARTDHQLNKPPYFVFDSILASGYMWNTLGDDGQSQPKFALVSTKAAFLLWVLWKTDYTEKLLANVEQVFDPERGWYEGRYERLGGYEDAITLGTNAVVLESLLYKTGGPIYVPRSPPGFFQLTMDNVFDRPKRCFPADQGSCALGLQ